MNRTHNDDSYIQIKVSNKKAIHGGEERNENIQANDSPK